MEHIAGRLAVNRQECPVDPLVIHSIEETARRLAQRLTLAFVEQAEAIVKHTRQDKARVHDLVSDTIVLESIIQVVASITTFADYATGPYDGLPSETYHTMLYRRGLVLREEVVRLCHTLHTEYCSWNIHKMVDSIADQTESLVDRLAKLSSGNKEEQSL